MTPNMTQFMVGSAYNRKSLWLCFIIFSFFCVQITASEGSPEIRRLTRPTFFHHWIEPAGSNATMQAEAHLLNDMLDRNRATNPLTLVEDLEEFIRIHPDSVWTPALQANMGGVYLEAGSYTRALGCWTQLWEKHKDDPLGPGKHAADYALASLARLLTSMGRTEAAQLLFDEAADRVLDQGPLSQKFQSSMEYLRDLKRFPTISYRCGWLVLNHLSQKAQGKRLDIKSHENKYQEGNLFNACSMRDLQQMAAGAGLDYVGVARERNDKTPFPKLGIIHYKQNHYILILDSDSSYATLFDPMWGDLKSVRLDILNAEASGNCLVPRKSTPPGWRELQPSEMDNILGRSGSGFWGFAGGNDSVDHWCENDECNCPIGPGGTPPASAVAAGGHPSPPSLPCLTCKKNSGHPEGMPRWQVSEPQINVWLHDVPISCQSAYNGKMELDLKYKQRSNENYRDDCFSFGFSWHSKWLSYVVVPPKNNGAYNYHYITAVMPDGAFLKDQPDEQNGAYHFPAGPVQIMSEPNYYNNSTLEVSWQSGEISGFTVHWPDGSKLVYSCSIFPGRNIAILSQIIDSQGFITRLNYSIQQGYPGDYLRLNTVMDHASNVIFRLTYYNNDHPHKALVQRVTDERNSSRYAEFSYDFIGQVPKLTQIRDAAGLTSYMDYQDNCQLGYLSSLTTPYGTTSFRYLIWEYPQTSADDRRFVEVTHPNNERDIYLFLGHCETMPNGSPGFPFQLPASMVPTGLPAGTQLDHTPHRLNSFYWNQKQAQTLQHTSPDNFINTLSTNILNKARMRHWLNTSLLQDAWSPEMTLSFERDPSANDGGTTWGQVTWYDYTGKPSGQPCHRGTQILPKLITRRLPGGSSWYESYERNSFGKVLTNISTYSSESGYVLTRMRTNSYYANGIDLKEEFDYSGNKLSSYTYNNRHQVLTEVKYANGGLSYTTTHTYNDSHGRLTSILSPAGQTTTFTYNPTGGFLSTMSGSPINRSESFSWNQGYLQTHTDARGLVRTFSYDGLGRITQIAYPDGTTEQFLYSLPSGRGFNQSGTSISILDVTDVKDRRGYWTRYGYDRLRRITSVTNRRGHTTYYSYCGCGGPESIFLRTNLVTTLVYDNAGRVTDISHFDGSSEHFTYNALGQVTTKIDSQGTKYLSYNNQGQLLQITQPNAWPLYRAVYDINDRLSQVMDDTGVNTTYSYDRMGRVLSRTMGGTLVESYGYSASQLGPTSFTDQYGTVYGYAYDTLGRKINETQGSSTQTLVTLQFGFHPAGDLTSLIDGKNQVTTWEYNAYGLLYRKYLNNQLLCQRWTPLFGHENAEIKLVSQALRY